MYFIINNSIYSDTITLHYIHNSLLNTLLYILDQVSGKFERIATSFAYYNNLLANTRDKWTKSVTLMYSI